MTGINEAETLTIGSFTYAVAKLPARAGVRLATRVGAMLAPVLADLAGTIGTSPDKQDAAIAGALQTLLTREDLDSQVEFLNNTLGAATQVHWTTNEGQPASRTLDAAFFDAHFRDNYDSWLQWLVFAVKVNLRSFFAGASALGAKLKAAKSPAPTTSVSSPQTSVVRTG